MCSRPLRPFRPRGGKVPQMSFSYHRRRRPGSNQPYTDLVRVNLPFWNCSRQRDFSSNAADVYLVALVNRARSNFRIRPAGPVAAASSPALLGNTSRAVRFRRGCGSFPLDLPPSAIRRDTSDSRPSSTHRMEIRGERSAVSQSSNWCALSLPAGDMRGRICARPRALSTLPTGYA